jgi:hypothetical protein
VWDVDRARVGRRYFDNAIPVGHHLPLVTAQVSGQHCAPAEPLHGIDHPGLLCANRLTQATGPVQIGGHQRHHVRVVEQGHDRVIPPGFRLQARVVLQSLEKSRCLIHL